MSRKGIPKKRIGPGPGSRERSIRVWRKGVKGRALNAAERSAYGSMSTSLCGIMEKKENKNEKEVVKGNRQSYYLAGRSCPVERGKFAARSEFRKRWG